MKHKALSCPVPPTKGPETSAKPIITTVTYAGSSPSTKPSPLKDSFPFQFFLLLGFIRHSHKHRICSLCKPQELNAQHDPLTHVFLSRVGWRNLSMKQSEKAYLRTTQLIPQKFGVVARPPSHIRSGNRCQWCFACRTTAVHGHFAFIRLYSSSGGSPAHHHYEQQQ